MIDSTFSWWRHRRRNVFRFGLRTALILISLVAIWLSVIANAAKQQKSAVAKLRKANIAVHYDYQVEVLTASELTYPDEHPARRFYPQSFTNQILVPPGPQWLRQLIGGDYFQTVTAVSIYDHFPTDQWASQYRAYVEASLPDLRQLSDLKEIFLHQPRDHADSKTFADVKALLEQECPNAKVTEIAFLTVR